VAIGVISRCVAPALRGDFTRYATLPSGRRVTRPLATVARVRPGARSRCRGPARALWSNASCRR